MHSRLGPDGVGDSDWGARVRSAFVIERAARRRPAARGRRRAAAVTHACVDRPPAKGGRAAALDPVAARSGSPRRSGQCRRASCRSRSRRAARHAGSGSRRAPAKRAKGSTSRRRRPGSPATTEVAFRRAAARRAAAGRGAARRRAARGDRRSTAAASCEQIEGALDPGHPLRERVVRETRRLRELAKWRLDFVEQWKAGGKKLRIEHDGAVTTGAVKQVDEGDLILLDAKGRDLRVALAALDCGRSCGARPMKLNRDAGAARLRGAGRKPQTSPGIGATPGSC
jgi:hypothetical protein